MNSVATAQAGKVFTVTARAALTRVTGDATLGTATIPVHLWIKPDLSQRSWNTLGLAPGSRVGAQVKTVVLIG